MGYLVNNFVKSSGIPLHIINPLINNIDVPYLIELGSAAGDSAREASKYFKQVVTVELIEERQIKENSPDNITWHTGNSVDILPQIVSMLNKEKKEEAIENCIWWIDSHYSGSELNTSEHKECYILEELQAISKCNLNNIILIDDSRLFFGAPSFPLDPRDWATIDDIFLVLRKYFPFNRTTIMDDYIISYPEHLKELFDTEWRKNFHLRYPSYEESIKTQARNVYNEIINYLK